MIRMPIHDIQEEEEWEEVLIAVVVATPLKRAFSADTISLDPEEGQKQLAKNMTGESTEEETSAKESTGVVLMFPSRENECLKP